MVSDVQTLLRQRPAAGPRGQGRPASLRLIRRGLNLAIVLALGPSILMSVAGAGVWAGMMDWSEGFAAFAAWASTRLALATIATGVLALIAAVLTDFERLWLRALLALSITAATLAGYVISEASPPVQVEAPAAAAR